MVFFARVLALTAPDAQVLDFGAGRGKFQTLDPPALRRVTDVRSHVAGLAGFDVDPVVLENEEADYARHAAVEEPLPFDDASFDLIYSWMVLEHVEDPLHVVAEIDRILKPGGWFCACTPNRWGYGGIGAQLVPNRFHVPLLRLLAPKKAEVDTFPTRFRMNTLGALRRLFPAERFLDASYTFTPPPMYHGGRLILARCLQALNWLAPPALAPHIHVFVQKRAAHDVDPILEDERQTH